MNLGNFKPHITIKESSIEDEEENLQGEEKTMFLQFLNKMIQWVPEDRRSAKELMEDPWLAFASW
jgi:hypothetical protein